MSYPTTIPSYPSSNSNMTLATFTHLSRHQQMENDIISLATKVGINSSADVSSIDYKLSSHIANTSNPHSTTKSQVGLGNVDNTSDATKQAATLQAVYPVGSIYISTSSTNPNTTFGFGTWAAFAAGRTIIGVGTSDQAFASGATGGESSHVLSSAEMPSHQHIPFTVNGNTGSIWDIRSGAGALGSSHSIGFVNGSGSASNLELTSLTGGDGAHNNLPPYIVVYMWQRTA